VLIVDESDDARAVLRTALARRGLQIWEAEDGTDGLRLAREHQPDVVVLDIDAAQTSAAVCEQFADQASRSDTSLVLLGTARGKSSSAGELAGEFVAKPYHYAPLIRKIEALLDQATRGRRRAA
jgi:two-component system phosphate regulon response regulator PhoB